MRLAVLVFLALALSACSYSREDYQQAAQGSAATQDRENNRTAADVEMSTLQRGMPGMDWRNPSVNEYCDIDDSSGALLASPDQVVCLTVVTRYAGFDGDLAEEIRQFDDVVAKAGWSSGSLHISQPIDYYERFRGRPEGPRTYDASNLPGVDYSVYHGARCEGKQQPWRLGHSWLEAGQPLFPHQLRGPELPVNPIYLNADSVDHQAVKTSLLAQHRYVAVISMTVQCNYAVS